MTTWQVLAELFTLVNQYGPAAAAIVSTAETYIKSSNWSGLAQYLEGLVAAGTLTGTPQVQNMVTHLKSA